MCKTSGKHIMNCISVILIFKVTTKANLLGLASFLSQVYCWVFFFCANSFKYYYQLMELPLF